MLLAVQQSLEVDDFICILLSLYLITMRLETSTVLLIDFNSVASVGGWAERMTGKLKE